MLDQPKGGRAKRQRPRPNRVPKREIGLNFIVQHQTIMFGGNRHYWPRVHLHEQLNGNTSLTPIDVLDEYYLAHPRYSDAWRLNTARAVGLFADFAGAKIQTMSLDEMEAPDEVLERSLLQGFAVALKFGTIGRGERYVSDPLRLGWRPRGDRQARTYLSSLSNFLEWMAKRNECSRWQWLNSNAKTGIGSSLRVAAELAIRKRTSLLAHLDHTERVPGWHAFAEGVISPQKVSTTAVHSFPSKWAVPFIFDCWDLDDEAQMTAATVVAILFCGGLRMSEPFHAYTTDVQIIEGMAHLFFQDPRFGVFMSPDHRKVTRAEYLGDFGLQPRNVASGRLQAGWKGMANDDTITQAFWLPLPALRQRTHELLMRYLTVTRPAIMTRRPRAAFDHPFLFVSASAHEGGAVGDPYTLSALRAAWAAAIKRLSRLLDDPEVVLKKSRGTTPHGARHFFGHFLKVLQVPPEIITRVMNHRHPASQEVYGRLSPLEINGLLSRLFTGADPYAAARAACLEDYAYFNQMNTNWSER